MIFRYRALISITIALLFVSPIFIINESIENVSAYSIMGSGVNGNQEILCDPTRSMVYLADPTGDTVAIQNYTANITTIVHVGLYPMSLDLSRDRSHLYVAVSGNDSIAVVNLDTLQVERNISLSFSPCSVRTGYADRIFVSRMDSIALVYIINSTSGETLSSIFVYFGDRFALQVSPDGYELVTATDGTSPMLVSYWTIANDTASLVARDDWGLGSNGQQQAVDWMNRRIYTASGYPYGIQILSLDTIQPIGFLDMGGYGKGVALTGDYKQVIGVTSGSLFVFNATTGELLAERGLESGLELGPVAISFDSSNIFVAQPLQRFKLSPDTPQMSSIEAGIGNITINWQPSVEVGLSNFTGYSVYRGMGVNGLALLCTTNLTKYVDTDLVPRQTYYYAVTASNSIRESPLSGVLHIRAIDKPDAPTGLKATWTDDQASLSWIVPADDGGSPITNYTIYRALSPGEATELTTLGEVLGYIDSALSPGTIYYYKVCAVNKVGKSPTSAEIAVTPGIPTAPIGLHAAEGYLAVDLNWTEPTYAGLGAIVYYLFRDGSLVWSGSDLNHKDAHLIKGTQYSYKVAASNSIGWGSNCSEVFATPFTIPDPPYLIEPIGGVNNVTLTWTEPMFNGGRAITHYNIYRSEDDGLTFVLIASPSSLNYTDSGLSNGQVCWYFVTAVNEAGESAFSNEERAVVLDLPGIPFDVYSVPLSYQVTLVWSLPSDGGSVIIHFAIYRGTSVDNLVLIGNSPYTSSSFIDTAVTPGSIYYYRVSAINIVGEGVMSENVVVTVPLPMLTGRIVDTDGNGLVSITVALENGSLVETNEEGDFSIAASPGNHTLTISGPGIETQTEYVIVDISSMELGAITAQKESESDSTWLYIGIGVVAILAVAGAAVLMMRRKK